MAATITRKNVRNRTLRVFQTTALTSSRTWCAAVRVSPHPLRRPRMMVGDGARAQEEDRTYAEHRGAMGAVHAVDSGEARVGPRQDLAPAAGGRCGGAAWLAVRAAQPRGVRRGVRVGRARAARARWPG